MYRKNIVLTKNIMALATSMATYQTHRKEITALTLCRDILNLEIKTLQRRPLNTTLVRPMVCICHAVLMRVCTRASMHVRDIVS